MDRKASFATACAWALLLLSEGVAAVTALTPEVINNVNFTSRKTRGISPVVLKAQVLLDRQSFSPGVIDGSGGENYKKALSAFQQRNQLNSTGRLDKITWEKLNENVSAPIVL